MDNWNLLKNMLIEEKVLSQKEAVSTVEKTVIFHAVDKLISTTKIERALRILDEAIQCNTSDAELYLKKSQILLEEGYIENAISVLMKAHSCDETNLDIIFNIVEAYTVGKDYEGGLKFIDLCLQYDLNGLEIELLIAKSNLLIEREETGKAYDLLVKMVFEFPNDAEVYTTFQKVISIERLHEEAVVVLEDVIKINPYAEYAWYALGHIQYYLCDFDQARMAYEYAFIIDPTFEKAYRHYVCVCHDTRRYKKALQAYSEMIDRFTLKVDDFINIAHCYLHFKDYDRALKFLDHALKKDRSNADIYYKISQVYLSQGTYTFCLNYINKALRIDDSNELFHMLSAEINYRLGNKNEAWVSFYSAVELDPMVESTWLDFIKVMIDEKDYDTALNTIADAEVETSSPLLAYLRVACLFGIGEEKEAGEVLEEALIESFEQHEVIFEMIPSLHSNKKIKSMIAYYLFEHE